MVVYILLKQSDVYEGCDIIYVSEDIEKVRKNFEGHNLNYEYFELEVWKDGVKIDNALYNEDVRKLLMGGENNGERI